MFRMYFALCVVGLASIKHYVEGYYNLCFYDAECCCQRQKYCSLVAVFKWLMMRLYACQKKAIELVGSC